MTFLKVLALLAIALAIPSIGLRWYARYKSSTLGVDDYLALLATLALIAVGAVQLASEFGSSSSSSQLALFLALSGTYIYNY